MIGSGLDNLKVMSKYQRYARIFIPGIFFGVLIYFLDISTEQLAGMSVILLAIVIGQNEVLIKEHCDTC
jgi:hypothetical protein